MKDLSNIVSHLVLWYQKNARVLPWREKPCAYGIWVSEIMLQQTRVEAIKVYYERFITRLPTLYDLATIEEDELLKLWEGLGYYSRVRNMQKTAKILIERGQDNLPNTKEELLKLPGIGDYTAGAILSIAYGIPSIAIDGNVYRVLGRYYAISESISKKSTYTIYSNYLESLLPEYKAGDFTQSFMDLGSQICLPKNPNCASCPLKNSCKARKENKMEAFPVKEKPKEKRVEERTVFILTCNDRIAINKRKEDGLLASLYEFPNSLSTPSIMDIENALYEQNIPYNYVEEIGTAKHIFSHVIWYMQGYKIELTSPLKEYLWVSKKDLIEKYSLPSAFSYYSEYIINN